MLARKPAFPSLCGKLAAKALEEISANSAGDAITARDAIALILANPPFLPFPVIKL